MEVDQLLLLSTFGDCIGLLLYCLIVLSNSIYVFTIFFSFFPNCLYFFWWLVNFLLLILTSIMVFNWQICWAYDSCWLENYGHYLFPCDSCWLCSYLLVHFVRSLLLVLLFCCDIPEALFHHQVQSGFAYIRDMMTSILTLSR